MVGRSSAKARDVTAWYRGIQVFCGYMLRRFPRHKACFLKKTAIMLELSYKIQQIPPIR
ncbi:hypothetical protein PHO31112_02946 [Pandoraea horticolens]|uniref:Uncharacterized protein n=1 Tax=Pandoraea horticolens TaxID=2508298 RepID=A0A5E4VZ44_9BURK|nr:hypothetical protein PHO31112_02946 [Pandoraea horticolens]